SPFSGGDIRPDPFDVVLTVEDFLHLQRQGGCGRALREGPGISFESGRAVDHKEAADALTDIGEAVRHVGRAIDEGSRPDVTDRVTLLDQEPALEADERLRVARTEL